MKWLRLRPEVPTELEMVDWRGRWIGSDDEYEDDDEDGENGAPMEDFDPDAGDDDDEESEEEEEEANDAIPVKAPMPHLPGRRRAAEAPPPDVVRERTPTPIPTNSPRPHAVPSLSNSSSTSIDTPADASQSLRAPGLSSDARKAQPVAPSSLASSMRALEINTRIARA